MKRIAILASGSGSNAERIISYFADNEAVQVDLILTNNPQAGVIERGRRLGIPVLIFDRTTFTKTDKIVELLKKQEIDWVILAGFLWLIPAGLIRAYPNRIINIHPAILPKYGGKGMWGHFVHEAVHTNRDTESGITIHFVNENYDEGEIIFQAKCDITESDTPDDIAAKVQVLEHQHFPEVIEKLILGQIKS